VIGWRRGLSGLTFAEVLVALAVLLVFAAIVIPIYSRARVRTYEDVDVQKMRQVYIAWSTYQSENNEWPPPSLLPVRRFLSNDALLVSQHDPFVQPEPKGFPIEPMLPQFAPRSPIRISYAYLGNYVRAGEAKIGDWGSTLLDPRIGVLASGWHGTVGRTGQPFEARIDGAVLRVNTDGSVFRLDKRRAPKKMGDPEDLFFRR
jgi:hypothetical protein